MGSSSSRPGPRPPRPPRTHHRHRTSKRKFLSSLLICGGSSSHAPIEMEEDPAELRVRSAEHSDPVVSKLQSTTKESVLTSGTETGFSIPKIVSTALPESGVIATEDPFPEDCSANVGISNQGKHLSESKELVPPHPPGVDQRSSDRASTSYEDQPPPDRAMGRANMDVLSDIDYVTEADVPECISPSLQEQGDSCSDRASIENHASEVTSVHNSESGSASVVSDSSVTYDSLRDGNLQEGIPSGLGFLVSERERRRDGGVLHLDVVSISSNILSSSSPDINNREARRNSRRLFWDAFSRRSSRRHSDSRTFVFSTDDSDDSGPNDRWLLDFNGDFFDDGVGSDTGHLGSRTDSINERRWHSRSEIWERLRGSRNERDRRTTVCPSGLHPDGTCTCESASMSEESGAHASISRIVMLAEALFEVLDEIHRQPVSLSLSMVSLPAPESVVDALPVKNHKSTVKTGNDVEQCYICLAEYEEGDKIRVLPCHHEYHMSCVDKWLKEIHGVCPLCRGDVREGFTEGSLSNSESPSN